MDDKLDNVEEGEDFSDGEEESTKPDTEFQKSLEMSLNAKVNPQAYAIMTQTIIAKMADNYDKSNPKSMDQWVVENPTELAKTFLAQHAGGGYKMGKNKLLPSHEFESVKCSLHDTFNKKHCISTAFDTKHDHQRAAEVRGQQNALNDLVEELKDTKEQAEDKLNELGVRLVEAACRFEAQKAKEDQEKIDSD